MSNGQPVNEAIAALIRGDHGAAEEGVATPRFEKN